MRVKTLVPDFGDSSLKAAGTNEEHPPLVMA
jgi:hypothetical protein